MSFWVNSKDLQISKKYPEIGDSVVDKDGWLYYVHGINDDLKLIRCLCSITGFYCVAKDLKIEDFVWYKDAQLQWTHKDFVHPLSNPESDVKKGWRFRAYRN